MLRESHIKSKRSTLALQDLDERVLAAIEYLFPDGTIPDNENFTTTGRQHKAPDHSVLDGNVLIERKSLNREDQGQIYSKIKKLTKTQGLSIRAFGNINAAHILRKLPNTKDANKIMTDYYYSQLDRCIGDARKKFSEHATHHPSNSCTRILIVSDNSKIIAATDSAEYFIGRMFIRNRTNEKPTGLIDCIIYAKRPSYVLDRENSYWFKCVINEDCATEKQNTARAVSTGIHRHLQDNYTSEFEGKFRLGRYRPLLA